MSTSVGKFGVLAVFCCPGKSIISTSVDKVGVLAVFCCPAKSIIGTSVDKSGWPAVSCCPVKTQKCPCSEAIIWGAVSKRNSSEDRRNDPMPISCSGVSCHKFWV